MRYPIRELARHSAPALCGLGRDREWKYRVVVAAIGDVWVVDGGAQSECVLANHARPEQVTTDLAAPLLRVVDEVLPDVLRYVQQYSNHRIENDHGRLKARPRPMRGLGIDRTASVVIRGHAFIQNLRRGHYELGLEARQEQLLLAAVFDQLTKAI